ncbi:peptide synthase [Shewanella sp. OPT22]|nr:peptide synthase [Shewanella sp. OPT22]
MQKLQSENKSYNLCRHLVAAGKNNPNDLAVSIQKFSRGQYQYQELNFEQLDLQSNRVATALLEHGLKPGMKAVLMVTPSIEFFQLTFALFKAGIIPVIVDPGMGVKNLKQCFNESEPDAFIGIPKAHIARRLLGWGKSSVSININVDSSHLSGLQSIITGAMNLSTILQTQHSTEFDLERFNADDMCAILFTSGSTGTPKGVVYSHRMFEAQITALREDYGIQHGERDLATFPLFSLFGPALGMASIVPDMDASKPITANPKHIFAAIEKYQCSNIFVNPALLDVVGKAGSQSKHKLPSIRRVISAGAPVTIEAIERFSTMLNDGVEVLSSYGATESLPISKFSSHELVDTAKDTNSGAGICVGYPIEAVNIAIIGISEKEILEWDDSLTLPSHQVGEIVVSGDMVNQRYYRRETATQKAKIYDKDLARMRHRMGDLGYLDDHGRLWMCGRKAHRVVTKSKLYYSVSCERIINTHPQVKRSALVGVQIEGKTEPLICLELNQDVVCSKSKDLYADLRELVEQHQQSSGVCHFLIHDGFPMDVRHNAKIFREKLAVWAQKKV